MVGDTIPNPVCAVVGEAIGLHYYNHANLNTLFWEHGAPGDPPEGNCVTKCTLWLKRCNSEPSVDAFKVLGGVLEEFMEAGFSKQEDRDRIETILAQYGLSYRMGGLILGASAAAPTRDLQFILKEKDLVAVQEEFERALATVEQDPPSALTAACSLIESLCKVYIQDEGLDMLLKQTIKSLWAVVANDLGLDPSVVTDGDLKRILGGLSSVIDGLGALRTHAGSAHGRGRLRYGIQPRHARLAVHAAHTLANFVLETWDENQARSAQELSSAL